MNLIIEDNLNFYDLLNADSDIEDEDENICLLTNEVLDENKITLPCNHSFNFVPLYKEICNQKKNANNLEICKVKYNQIKCPYCRQIHDVLLPHIKLTNAINFISGVNTPANLCMKFHTCEWKMKSGKNKGKKCENIAKYQNNGYYCNYHCKHSCNVKVKQEQKLCCAILKSGKRKGEPCNNKVHSDGIYCKRHSL